MCAMGKFSILRIAAELIVITKAMDLVIFMFLKIVAECKCTETN